MLAQGSILGWLRERMQQHGDRAAIVWQDREVGYRELAAELDHWNAVLAERDVQAGESIAIDGDYSPSTCALLLALIERRCVAVPLSSATPAQKPEFMDTARVSGVFRFDRGDAWSFERRDAEPRQALLQELVDRGAPGLVLFSSGSTGAAKAVLHDFGRLLAKFEAARQAMRCLVFLFLDHIGGINTLFSIFSSGGTVICARSRNIEDVCAAIQTHRAELLPTSPTMLRLLLMSGAHERYDLSSLRLITYGTEPMPKSTLEQINEAFPEVEIKQTYGLSELGILRSKSKDSRSLFVKIGGDGYETKVVNGILWIRASSAMLGYLNAPSPFDADGWMETGDQVVVEGEFMHILGRRSELINVGGEKVYPTEVEAVLLQLDNIEDATVFGKPSPIMGHVVAARVKLREPEDLTALRKRIAAFCGTRLARYKIPLTVEIDEGVQYSSRFKKIRRTG